MDTTRISRHVFVSYSHSDEAVAKKMIEDLKNAHISTWVDESNLKPGTSDWERAIREAIEDSFAVVLLASPTSKDSVYVAGELAVAESLSRPIYPIWVKGDKWIDSIPLGLSKSQYIDCRMENYESGLKILLKTLKEVISSVIPSHVLVEDFWHKEIAVPPNFLCISSIVSNGLVIVNPEAYGSLQSLLNDLYVHYLYDTFAPLTYGKDWVLEEVGSPIGPNQIAVPWNWILDQNIGRSIGSYDSHMTLSEPLPKYGLRAATIWTLRKPSEPGPYGKIMIDNVYGIAINNRALRDELLSGYNKQPPSLIAAGYLKIVPLKSVDPDDYEYLIVTEEEWASRAHVGNAVVQTDKDFRLSENQVAERRNRSPFWKESTIFADQSVMSLVPLKTATFPVTWAEPVMHFET